MMAIGERIHFFRILRGMTQKYLGTIVGFPERSADVRLAQYETGTRKPKAELTAALAQALDVSPHALDVPDIDSYIGLMHTLFTVLAASNLNAKCIITPSVSGATARVVSNLRPRQVILGVTPNERTLRRMSIYWGVKPIKSQAFNTTDDICDGAIELAKVKQFVETGEIVVITAGIPSPNVKKERSATSNMMRIATVE